MNEDAKFFPGGQGGFLDPPEFPTHTCHVESDLRRRRSGNQSSTSITYVTENPDDFPGHVVEEARRRIQAWYDERPLLTSFDADLWVRRCFAHWRNCYVPPAGYHEAVAIVGYGISAQEATELEPYAENFIKRFYPEFNGHADDYSVDCAACGHHVNAHASSEGGMCTAYIARENAGSKVLCQCPQFQTTTHSSAPTTRLVRS